MNRPPLARDDESGVRPGRTTVLEVLENDTDPDGDVLTIASDVRDRRGGRAARADRRRPRAAVHPGRRGRGHRLVPLRASTTAGRGRRGIRRTCGSCPSSENTAPTSMRSGAISVEQGQQLSYNVLADWNDPDGDDLYLVNASPTGGDSVRFEPRRLRHLRAQVGRARLEGGAVHGLRRADDGGRHADRRGEAHGHAESQSARPTSRRSSPARPSSSSRARRN